MKHVFTITTLVGLHFTIALPAQELLNKDSLLQLLPQVKPDSAGVDYFIALGQQYENNQPEQAKAYYRRARDISMQLGYTAGIIKFINNYTYVLNLQGLYDSSLLLNLEGIRLARETNDSLNLGKTLINTGTTYRFLARFEEAIKCYEEGKRIMEFIRNPLFSAQIGDIIALLYIDLKQYDKAIAHAKPAVDYFRKAGNDQLLSIALNNLAIAYSKKHKLKEALSYFRQTLALGEKLGDSTVIASALLNIGDIYLKQGHYHEMEPYYRRALAINERMGALESQSILCRALAYVEMSKQNYPAARQWALQSLQLAREHHFPEQERKTLEALANIHYALHDMPQAEKYAQQATLLGDSILNESVTRNTLEIEKRFEAEKKELRIRQLEADRAVQELSMKQKSTMNGVLTGGMILISLIALLTYRNYRHKQKLQLQRINELETEKQLAATEAVLKGEEQERTRLAKDLHDGLGGMLSGIKYTMNAMKGNLIMKPEDAQAFERSMDMLDSSIREMRRVAHNLMPETLVKFGLDTALRDYCNDINQSGAIQINYQSFGLEGTTLDQTIAISIYRIIQELIGNILRHAAAKTAIVQVSKTDDMIILTVEDDGKGFDPNLLKQSKGIGWTNIQNRIAFLQGKLDVYSTQGKGTSVTIEIPV